MFPSGLPEHGIGGSTDLPIPFLYAMVGASWALTISFAVLALAWREPKFDTEPETGPGEAEAGPRRPWLAVVGARRGPPGCPRAVLGPGGSHPGRGKKLMRHYSLKCVGV